MEHFVETPESKIGNNRLLGLLEWAGDLPREAINLLRGNRPGRAEVEEAIEGFGLVFTVNEDGDLEAILWDEEDE